MKMHAEGEELDMHRFINKAEQESIAKAKEALPEAQGLREYFDFFEEKVPYWKIKLGLYLLDR